MVDHEFHDTLTLDEARAFIVALAKHSFNARQSISSQRRSIDAKPRLGAMAR
jgi:hypothetical protein